MLGKWSNLVQIQEENWIMLSRYECYLIFGNGDSRKKVIALEQTYCVIKKTEEMRIGSKLVLHY